MEVVNVFLYFGLQVFGSTKFETEQQSLIFVKKLVFATISNITYLRSMFPEEAYAKKTLNKMPLRILKEKNGDEKASILAKWLRGAFEAIEKKYLKVLTLMVVPDLSQPDVVQEMYKMKFSYPGGLAQCEVQGRDEAAGATKLSTIDLISTVVELCQGLAPLPDIAHLSMKLLYYDEVTPEDYEPVGFQVGYRDHLIL